MTYSEAMTTLNDAIYAALRAALNEDGAPVDALRIIARDVDCLIDHSMTYAELQHQLALYQGAKQAGLIE